MIRRASLVALLGLVPSLVAAQASQFGVRSLGLPLTPASTAAQGMGAAWATFDPESPLNPAALTRMNRAIATFNLRQHWRSSENPFGSASGNDTQFPLVIVGGPIGRRIGYGVSAAGLTDRTFSVPLTDTLVIRDQDLIVNDTLTSRGGITDIRLGVAYALTTRWSIGVGLHGLTGTNRIDYRRSFSDSAYFPVRLRNELSVAGPGISVGLLGEPVTGLRVSAMYRKDGDLRLNKDSTRIASIPMPATIAGGILWTGARLGLGGHVLARNWSVQNEYLLDEGGTGATNTLEVAVGGQVLSDPKQPLRLPLRFGARYASLPYPVAVGGEAGKELALATGTGFMMGGGRAVVDLMLEYARRSNGARYTEQALTLGVGVAIRP